VIGAAIENAQRHFGRAFRRVVIVGDTPHDVQSARANRAHALAVATGRYGADTLRAAGASVALEDFSALQAALAALDALPFE
jgi:phosphoglycolate phosphatase-like HAD superfamily hydrolase